MTAVVLWKEYRQQRAIWLAIAILAALMAPIMIVTLNQEAGWRLSETNYLRWIMVGLVDCMVMTYGVVSGVLLLASEKEEGTLPFLDNLTGRRTPIWLRKVWAGILLTVAQSALLGTLGLIFGFIPWEAAVTAPLLGLDALAHGLLAGALFRTVLGAVLAGSFFLMASSLLAVLGLAFFPVVFPVESGLLSAALAIGVGYFVLQVLWKSNLPTPIILGIVFLSVLGLLLATHFLSLVILGNVLYRAARGAPDLLVVIVNAFQLALLACFLSWRVFCRDDRYRRGVSNNGFLDRSILFLGILLIVCLYLAPQLPIPFDEGARLKLGLGILVFAALCFVAGGATAVSWEIARQRVTTEYAGPATSAGNWLRNLFAPWKAIAWLALRQGRWILVACVSIALVVGVMSMYQALFFWPIGTLILGMLCGLTVFCPDQKDAHLFLGAQRVPAGRYWTGKILFWGIGLFVFCFAVYSMATNSLPGLRDTMGVHEYGLSRLWISKWDKMALWSHVPDTISQAPELFNPFVFVGIWPVYGFCIGQFFGQFMKRPVLALILTVILSPVVVALFVPSLVIGGVMPWQVAAIPILLLLSTRLAFWPWLSGRLWTLKPLILLTCSAALMVASLGGFLWYRAVQVPDVGAPFDVKAFIASLPAFEKDEAGPLLRKALVDFTDWRKQAEYKLGMPPHYLELRNGIVVPHGNSDVELSRAYFSLAENIVVHGWPKANAPVNKWLNEVFEGPWAKEIEAVARLPLGLAVNPLQGESGPYTLLSNIQRNNELAYVLMARAVQQQQANGNSAAALAQYQTVLGLVRQLKNDTPTRIWLSANAIESTTVNAYGKWLERVGPNKTLLRDGLKMLLEHEAATPDPANNIKADYVMERALASDPFWRALPQEYFDRVCALVPWEKERQRRIMNATFLGNLQTLKEPSWEYESLYSPEFVHGTRAAHSARLAGLPPVTGAGSNVSPETWFGYLNEIVVPRWNFVTINAIRNLAHLRAQQLVSAVALYQAEHGKAPKKLEELVPDYVLALPIDPLTGKSFAYVVVQRTQTVKLRQQEEPLRVVAGQAFILDEAWYLARPPGRRERRREDDDVQEEAPQEGPLLDHGRVYPVPVWNKK